MNKLVTVVIPTYNEKEELIRKAIESVLNQTYQEIELIVVDDGSTDSTPEILRSYGKDIRVFRRERDSEFRSVSYARNIGLEKAKGRWWSNLDADWWLEKDWAERCIEFIAGRENEILGVHTDVAIHRFDGSIEHVHVGERYDPCLSTLENYKKHEAMFGKFFRMDVCRKAGPFDTRFPRKQNREWTLRFLQHGNLVYLPRELAHFVFHEPDQMKYKASVKYRILADLKNGIDIEHNMRIACSSEDVRYAMVDAFRAFFTDPEWSKERTSGETFERIEKAKKICDEEASEQWERI